MNYNGTIYRPPIEAHTMLIPVTEGCTHNKCTFCNMYQNVPFRMWTIDEVENYVAEVKSRYGRLADSIDRVYLVGADPFALSAGKLLERISLIKKYLPNVTVITMYARTDNIAHKSDEDLKRLKEAGVNDLYIGVECGLNDVLADLNKGYSADETREQCLRLNAVGISHCDLLMLGTAGKGRGLETAKATAALENEIKPAKILLNTMSAFEGTVLDKDIRDGRFVPAAEKEILQEEYAFLQALELPDTYFWAIHPLDSVSIKHKVLQDEDGVAGYDVMKTKSSYRTLPLIPVVEQALIAEREHQAEMKKAFGRGYCKKYEDYICVDAVGELIRPNYVSDHFPIVLRKNGLRKIRFHDLRHSCASLLLANGVQMKLIQEWLGHSDIGTTSNVYSHVDSESKKLSAEAIAKALSE